MITNIEKSILEYSCIAYGVESVKVLTSRFRYKHISNARELAARLLRLEGLSLYKIGALLNRDHSTIVYILKKEATKDLQDKQEQIQELIQKLKIKELPTTPKL